jgi:hypothetical protein
MHKGNKPQRSQHPVNSQHGQKNELPKQQGLQPNTWQCSDDLSQPQNQNQDRTFFWYGASQCGTQSNAINLIL